ncbi:MAG: hypothetical protein ABFD07_11830, partial [Methanobacterium sp.]
CCYKIVDFVNIFFSFVFGAETMFPPALKHFVFGVYETFSFVTTKNLLFSNIENRQIFEYLK